MRTVYLRFTDRGAALVRLAAVLGHEIEVESAMLPTTGRWHGERFDVDEVGVLFASLPPGAAEDAVPEPLPGWHINLLWWGEDKAAPDFGADEITPATPSRVFAPPG